MKTLFFLIFISLNAYASTVFLDDDTLNEICGFVNNIEKEKLELKNLNAYDRAEERIRINEKIKKMFLNDFIIRIRSKEFELNDYDFKNNFFEINNIKYADRIKLEVKVPIRLNVSKEKAKMIAAKKKFGILDLYIKIELKKDFDFFKSLCSSENNEISVIPSVKEYFFMCSKSNEVIDYEILQSGLKYKFIDIPFIESVKNKKTILSKINYLNKKLLYCKNRYKGFGTKIYKVKIDKDGDIFLINRGSSFKNKKLEECIDKQILNTEFPKEKKVYSIYFSVVFSNIE